MKSRYMRYRYVFFLSVFVTVFGQGCSHLTMLRTEELRAVGSRVDSLKSELTALQKEMMENQESYGELLRAVRAEQNTKFNELNGKISALLGTISESQHHLSQIDRKTSEINKRWEEKVRTDSMMTYQKKSEIENLFSIAKKDFNSGRYDLAINGFQDIVKQYPDDDEVSRAEYWIAECYYAGKKYNEAEKQFIHYIKNYPEGEKICAALYKLGIVYGKMGKEKSRKMVWEKVTSSCPGSDEALAVESAGKR